MSVLIGKRALSWLDVILQNYELTLKKMYLVLKLNLWNKLFACGSPAPSPTEQLYILLTKYMCGFLVNGNYFPSKQ
jgi:hypothetical protein